MKINLKTTGSMVFFLGAFALAGLIDASAAKTTTTRSFTSNFDTAPSAPFILNEGPHGPINNAERIQIVRQKLKTSGYHRITTIERMENGGYVVEALTELGRPVELRLAAQSLKPVQGLKPVQSLKPVVILFLDVFTPSKGRPITRRAMEHRLTHEGFEQIKIIASDPKHLMIQAQEKDGQEVEIVMIAVTGEIKQIARLGL